MLHMLTGQPLRAAVLHKWLSALDARGLLIACTNLSSSIFHEMCPSGLLISDLCFRDCGSSAKPVSDLAAKLSKLC